MITHGNLKQTLSMHGPCLNNIKRDTKSKEKDKPQTKMETNRLGQRITDTDPRPLYPSIEEEATPNIDLSEDDDISPLPSLDEPVTPQTPAPPYEEVPNEYTPQTTHRLYFRLIHHYQDLGIDLNERVRIHRIIGALLDCQIADKTLAKAIQRRMDHLVDLLELFANTLEPSCRLDQTPIPLLVDISLRLLHKGIEALILETIREEIGVTEPYPPNFEWILKSKIYRPFHASLPDRIEQPNEERTQTYSYFVNQEGVSNR
jgi:hypothetical protein